MAIESVVDRFLRYVAIDTQSDEENLSSPSTQKQFDLARLLQKELTAIGLKDVVLSEQCVVMATLPATVSEEKAKQIPVVGFLAHVDTAPSVSGKDVKPQTITYEGGDIVLPGDKDIVIKANECPTLAHYVGKKIITTDGTTLLGADDKAGVAAIMHAMETLVKDPSIEHGTIRVAFTPDEEIGRGTENFDIKAFAADLAYTIDGGEEGEVENETFCADGATVIIGGRNQHPGYAKDIMVNSLRVAADFISRLPRHRAPETTEDREDYLHPDSIKGTVEETSIKMLVRSFTTDGLKKMEAMLEEVRAETQLLHPKATIAVNITEQYRNMVYQLNEKPQVVEHAITAVKRAGVKPLLKSIRGGTDGARLTEMGLPTPNIYAGGLNFHSKTEWIAIEALESASKTIIELSKLWAEQPNPTA